MSRLLLAQAARLAGWTADHWRDGWPDLLSHHEIATLEAAGDRDKERDILALFAQDPPPADEIRPGYPSRMVSSGSIWDDRPPSLFMPGEPDAPLYRAETYRNWPPRDWPPSPLIAAWLASAGADDARPDAEPVKRKATESRDEALRAVVDAIESRAQEIGHPFDRAGWPGTKAEFRAFLTWHCPGLAYSLPTDDDRLSDELTPCGAKFGRPGRAKDKGRKFYKALFPDYPA